MRKEFAKLVIGLAIVPLATTFAHAYELATHAALTQQAFARSNLNSLDQRLIKDLGINVLTQSPSTQLNPFGNTFLDVQEMRIELRSTDIFEQRLMPGGPNNLNPDYLKINGWLMRGAIREDDVLHPTNGQPLDPYNTGNELNDIRPLNHFFDPISTRGLTVAGFVTLADNAPNWALGSLDIFFLPNTPQPNRRNHFTVLDAREALWRALTLKRRNADGTWTDILPSGHLTTTEAVRNAYWATTFRALGDVLHLNQDRAPPAHTGGQAIFWTSESSPPSTRSLA